MLRVICDRMSDGKAAPKQGVRTVADLKVTGRNKEGEEPVAAIGEAIRAVFADCSEAGVMHRMEFRLVGSKHCGWP